jgi:hypothetical protein
VFENRVLRRIFEPKMDEVTEGWRKLHNEELRDLYSSPSIIRTIKLMRMRWPGYVALMRKRRNVCRLLLRKPEGTKLLGKPRRRWLDNIKTNLGGMELGDIGWIGLAQARDKRRALVNAVTNLRVP